MSVTMRQMLEAGVHFGHQTRYWNPKMAQYIFGQRNKIHIINLEKTLAMYQEAMKYVRQLAANRGTILFVGTKRQAREIVAEEAQRCRHALRRPPLARRHADQLQDRQGVDQAPEGDGSDGGRTARFERMSKREALGLQREMDKLQALARRHQGAWTALPDALFVIDVGYHKIAVTEAEQARHPGRRRGRHQPFARTASTT